MNQRIEMLPVDEQHNRRAREAARSGISWPVNLTPASVSYLSDGHVLLVGNERHVRLAASELMDKSLASVTLLVTEPVGDIPSFEEQALDDERLIAETRECRQHALAREQARQVRIEGHLGSFSVSLLKDGETLNLAKALADRPHFDSILDLGETPLLSLELPPPGYVKMKWNAADRVEQLEAFAGLVGEFDKPRYFQINNDLCAHASSGNIGCTRCLDVCPADAITSHQGRIEAWIEIDPFRCHGVGSCSSACPTGAIQFRMPETHRQQETVLSWLQSYRKAGGTAPIVRFVEAEDLAGEGESAGHVLDVPLEELGAAGHDQWLTALAGGAAEVRVQCHEQMPERLKSFIDDQLSQAHVLLEAFGHSSTRVKRVKAGDNQARDALPDEAPMTDETLSFGTSDKRQRLNAVLDRLAGLGTPDGERHRVTSGAAYGSINVDQDACTLCLACVANCPTPALAAGDASPLLSFREADCVQCGLCVQACPEDAITLSPGFLASDARSERRVCHEEAAFDCIRCGKPFATTSTVETIKAKLANHPYFAGDAMARLEMCEDCRVKDVWHEMARNPDAQLKV
ncbi:MAG TPA: 4Fe-4S dicluster domain-containing protein [Halomonas sp.]|nr:4Fe-4S dicluster domain-containing protein [Halomonas sp.]